VQLSLALNWAVGGTSVGGYHVVNLVVHVLASVLLYGIAARTLRGSGTALAIALLWALHPLQTESVTYVVQRAESLMALCYLLTLYLVVRGADAKAPTAWYAAAVAACALGMLCKPVMVTARSWCCSSIARCSPGASGRVARPAGLYVGLFATWAILVALLAGQEHESAATAGFAMRDVSLAEFARSQPGVVLRYLQLVVWPHGLVLDYGWPPAQGFAGVAAPTVALFGGVAALLFAFRGQPKLAFLVLAFVLILWPSSSVVPIRDLAFEHRMYLPLAPLVALLVVGARRRSRAVGSHPRARTAWRSARPCSSRRRSARSPSPQPRLPKRRRHVERRHDEAARQRPRLVEPRAGLHGRGARRRGDGGRAHGARDRSVVRRGARAPRPRAREPRRLPRGRAEYAQAVRLAPDSSEAHNNWGATSPTRSATPRPSRTTARRYASGRATPRP
jgi:hypothetical protein